jgi:trehalose 6-phosphate synthase/phosphatase
MRIRINNSTEVQEVAQNRLPRGCVNSNADSAASLFRKAFSNRRLILASNREPYIHQRTKGGDRIKEPIGGLTSSLDPVMTALGGTWIAWGSGNIDREFSDGYGRERVPPFNPSYTLKRVWLSDDEVNHYYYGFSNQVLWPLFHYMTDKVRLRRKFWNHYRNVNEKFGRAIVEELGAEKGVVWLQDYHLALCPQIIRSAAPNALITQFWHIPWVAPEVLRVIPTAEELLEGLLANDMMTFHTPRYTHNFLEACDRFLDCEVDFDRGIVTHRGHRCHVTSVPISIDAEEFNNYASSNRSGRFHERFRAKFGVEDCALAISVDRIDYTKGLLEKINALELFFLKYPHWRGRFSMVMVSASSRDNIRAYSELKTALLKRIGEVNKRFEDGVWRPIIFTGALDKWSLTPLYSLCDMAIISSLCDGMNLVAKEYIAGQVTEHGVLLLSEFAGSSEEMADAVPINPYDTEDFADKIALALSMPAGERAARMKNLRRRLFTHTIFDWMCTIFANLQEVAGKKN